MVMMTIVNHDDDDTSSDTFCCDGTDVYLKLEYDVSVVQEDDNAVLREIVNC